MDCRKTLCLACGLLTALSGCKTLGSRQPPPAESPSLAAPTPGTPPLSNPPKPAPAAPPADSAAKTGKLKPETCVTIGDVHLKSLRDPERTPQQREVSFELARQAYQNALKEDANYLPAHTGLARLFAAMGEHQRAVDQYRSALRISRKDAGLWNELAMAHAQAKEFEPAVNAFNEALKLDPDNRSYRKSLGLTLARGGNAEAAHGHLVRCVGEAQSRLMIGRMLVHIDRPEEGAAQLQLALNLDPTLEDAQVLLQELRSPTPGVPGNGVMQAGHTAAQ